MAKLSITISVLISSLSIALLLPWAYSGQPNNKVIKLRFFLQDKYQDPARTVYPVARSDNITSTSPTSFGEVSVVNDPLTVGPDHNSELIGHAQGIIASADLKVPAIHATITFCFTAGEYKGSSFNMVGRNNLFEEFRKIPIVGGTGAFEMARGIITTSNYSSDPATNRATFVYDIVAVAQKLEDIAMY
ncbi:dirigent protein 23 [Phtheirospermum japonicum]|uniref:Dirigent protein n=1 Tax=Phtheirospermum japonicum TaxID=374723 RepID=A0A830D5X5_9LAMI|nr:dirigent protein 23 [Phtheirospermum japonicum]